MILIIIIQVLSTKYYIEFFFAYISKFPSIKLDFRHQDSFRGVRKKNPQYFLHVVKGDDTSQYTTKTLVPRNDDILPIPLWVSA
jgi:hypothetical protein